MNSDGALAFEVKDASFSYRDTPALNGISLEIRRGERVALLGANGSGKSTLLRLLAGLSFVHRGTVSFFGEELTPAKLAREDFFLRFRRSVGVVFQNSDVQLFNASVLDEIAFGPLQLGWPRDRVQQSVEHILASTGIAHLRDRAPHRLSGGEKKRVALASVLITEPEVLLMDEPITGLDPGSQSQLIDLLSSWNDGSRTVVTAIHELAALESIADRCWLLDRGSVAAEGPPLQVLHDARLLERTNLIRPHRHSHGSGAAQVHPHLHTHER